MKKKFEATRKKEMALMVNVKAREKTAKAKIYSLKRDTDQVLLEKSIAEEKMALLDAEIER